MSLRVGIDFGTSNSGVAVSDGSQVHLLPVDRLNSVPEVVKSILYITKDHRTYIGQEAIQLYYRHNVNRTRRFVKKWAGEIDYHGAEMDYVTDVFVYVDELRPGRLLQFIKTALRSENYTGTDIFDRYFSLADIIALYLGELKKRSEALLHEKIRAVTLGRPVKFSNNPKQDQAAEDTLRSAASQAGLSALILSSSRWRRLYITRCRLTGRKPYWSSTLAAARWILPSCAWATRNTGRFSPAAASASPAATSTGRLSRNAFYPISAKA